jgi:hypothetical protein
VHLLCEIISEEQERLVSFYVPGNPTLPGFSWRAGASQNRRSPVAAPARSSSRAAKVPAHGRLVKTAPIVSSDLRPPPAMTPGTVAAGLRFW